MDEKSIIFMGTPDFAAESLRTLHENFVNIKAVVTQPDKKQGRGMKVRYTPVKEMAIKLGLPVIQPENVKSDEFIEKLKKYDADLFVVVAFSILPKKVINLPKIGSINLHASLLPDYRGAAPINYALFNGDEKTGLTIFFLNCGKVDSGDIVDKWEVSIDKTDNFGTLYEKLKAIGSLFLLKTIEKILGGDYSLSKQEACEKIKKAPKIFSQDMMLDFSQSAVDIHNKIRGLAPNPGAFTLYREKRLKILESELCEDGHGRKFGEVYDLDNKNSSFKIACGIGALKVIFVKPEGKGVMPASSFINGYRLEEGDILG